MDETVVTEWGHQILTWIGFGTLVGLLAKMILPGKDPGGALATVVIGLFGSLIGASVLYFLANIRVSPISLSGFAAGLAGTTLILASFRLLMGSNWANNVTILRWRKTPARRRASVLDE